MRAECAVGEAYNVKDGSCRRDTPAPLDGDISRTAHGSRYCFGKPVVSVSACSSGRCKHCPLQSTPINAYTRQDVIMHVCNSAGSWS